MHSGILITWSDSKGVDTGVQAALLQIYPVLLSALISINRETLSIDDIGYALALTWSPLTIYLVFASCCDILGAKTGLYKRITSHPRIVRFLLVLIPFLWLGLTLTAALSSRTFVNSNRGHDSFSARVESLIAGDLAHPHPRELIPSLTSAVIGSILCLCLFRRRFQAWAELLVPIHNTGVIKGYFMTLEWSWRIMCRHHRWYIYSVFTYLDFGWVFSILLFNSDFTFSYGQILAMFSMAPALLSTVELVVSSSRRDLALFFRHLPGQCWAEAVYLVAGIELDPRERISLVQLASFLPYLLPLVRSRGGVGRWEDGEFPDRIV